jgi:hypothetical protein
MAAVTLAIAVASLMCLAGAPAASTDAAATSRSDAEEFDVSGLPQPPTSFEEQRLWAMIKAHRPGEADAALIQRKLAAYYRAHGDAARAEAAERRARGDATARPADAAEARAAASGPAPSRPAAESGARPQKAQAGAAPGAAAACTGRYYGMDGRTLHTWEFTADGAFQHSIVSSGAGTSVRTGERGRCEVAGDTLVLYVEKTATGFASPGVGGRSTQVGGGADTSREVRRLHFKKLGKDGAGGMVLDGVTLKPKSW